MIRKTLVAVLLAHVTISPAPAQVKWVNVDSLFQPLPSSVHLFFTNDSLDGKPNRAFCAIANLTDKSLGFTVDTTHHRRLTPSQYYKRNNSPLLVVNCTFFSPQSKNLNVVIKNSKLLALNVPSVFNPADSLYHYLTRSAIGIDRHRHADVAWVFTDSSKNKPWALPEPLDTRGDKPYLPLKKLKSDLAAKNGGKLKTWRQNTAVGGGPTLISNGKITITNNEERMFSGEKIKDKHPRTAMGYTSDGCLIVLAIEGRFPGKAEGATLGQEARMLSELGCYEALNLDGGGSSCLLINGRQTITPSDKTGQRPVPAVFMIKTITRTD